MDALLDEVESLEAILMEDVRITRNQQSGIPELIETTIFPVVSEDAEQQYVCVTLQVLFSAGYPEETPTFKLLKPRGLDDMRLESIRAACALKLQELQGCPVVFDLIETVRELLTDSNLPSGQCVVCLYGFTDGDEFTRTECFHFLHSYCLGRHLNAMRRNYQEEYDKLPTWLQKKAEPFQALCPVCREVIKDESDSLKCAMPPAELQNAPSFQLTMELRHMQQRMAALYLQQKEKGGIIDLEAEKATVLTIETEQELRRRLARSAAAETTAAKTAFEYSAGEQISNQPATETADGMLEYASVKPSGSRNSSNNLAQLQSKSQANSEAAEQHLESNKKGAEQQANYHKRHYRGGRRHQYHQHHHRESRAERDRERFEYNHGSVHALKNETAATGTGNKAHALATNNNNNHGAKTTKANAVNITQNR